MPPQVEELKELKESKRDEQSDDSDSRLSIDESGDVDMSEKKDKTNGRIKLKFNEIKVKYRYSTKGNVAINNHYNKKNSCNYKSKGSCSTSNGLIFPKLKEIVVFPRETQCRYQSCDCLSVLKLIRDNFAIVCCKNGKYTNDSGETMIAVNGNNKKNIQMHVK